MRSLIIAPRSLSQAVMSQPLVAALNRLHLKHRVDVVAHPDIAPVYESMLGVGRVWSTPDHLTHRNLVGMLMLARQLRRQHYRKAYVLEDCTRAALLPWVARIPVRIAAHPRRRWPFITDVRASTAVSKTAGPEPAGAQFLRLAFDGTAPVPGAVASASLTRRSEREVAARWRSGLPDAHGLLVLSVDAQSQASRQWPVRHWSTLIGSIHRLWPDLTVVAVGEQRSRDMATEVLVLSGVSGRNLCGQLSMLDMMSIVSQADSVIGLDNELMHVAAAFKRPLVSLFGPTDARIHAPASPNARMVWMKTECSPCSDPVCRYGHNRCMTELQPEQVMARLKTLLQRTSGNIR